MAGDMSISCLFFYFFAIRYKMADWWPFCYLNVSPQPFLRFASSELVQTWHKQSTWWHTCATRCILRSYRRWATGGLAAILIGYKYWLALLLRTAKLLKQRGLWHFMPYLLFFLLLLLLILLLLILLLLILLLLILLLLILLLLLKP